MSEVDDRDLPPGWNSAQWLVSGRVQGVGFRYHVLQSAHRFGIIGDVRNLRDGRVEGRLLLGAHPRLPKGSRAGREQEGHRNQQQHRNAELLNMLGRRPSVRSPPKSPILAAVSRRNHEACP